MDKEKRQKITKKLREILKREPTEGEIMNGQTDYLLMAQILEEEIKDLKDNVKYK